MSTRKPPAPGREQHERQKHGVDKARKRRSKNTRRRSLSEVRAALHDAAIIVNSFARHEKRLDATVLAQLLALARSLLPMAPLDREGLTVEVHRLFRGLHTEWNPDGWDRGTDASMFVPVSAGGLVTLRTALAEQDEMRRERGVLARQSGVNSNGGEA